MTQFGDMQISFNDMITKYGDAQKKVSGLVACLAKNMSSVSPGQFLLLQFQMGNLSQIGDSISNLLSSVNGIMKNTVSNMRG
jgi:hypothetical protein